MSLSGLGAALRRAREEQGLTLEDAERDTRISKRYLEALEEERFDVVPAPVYARGFLRSYSQYLGLDANEVLSLYPREEDQVPQRNQRGRERSSPPPPKRRNERDRRDEYEDEYDEEPARAPARPNDRRREPEREPERPRERRREVEGVLPFEEDQYPPRMEDPRGTRRREPQPLRPATLTHRDGLMDADRRQAFIWIAIAVGAIIVVALIAFLITRAGDDGGAALGPGITNTPGEESVATNPAATGTLEGGATEVATTEPTSEEGGEGTVAPPPDIVPGVMPDLRGQTGAAAKEILTEMGLNWNIVPLNGADEDTGIVTDHFPNPGEPTESEGTVSILVDLP